MVVSASWSADASQQQEPVRLVKVGLKHECKKKQEKTPKRSQAVLQLEMEENCPDVPVSSNLVKCRRCFHISCFHVVDHTAG